MANVLINANEFGSATVSVVFVSEMSRRPLRGHLACSFTRSPIMNRPTQLVEISRDRVK